MGFYGVLWGFYGVLWDSKSERYSSGIMCKGHFFDTLAYLYAKLNIIIIILWDIVTSPHQSILTTGFY